MDFDNSQKRGFARLDVLGGLRRAAHLSKSAPRNDENSGTLLSLLRETDLTTCASELRARLDGENDVVIADVNRSPVKRERVRNRLNVLTTLRKAAFTLAEVLVTLAVIGIVAAMTIPTVMNKYQQKVTETRLMRFYSVMNNAIALSEIDNGDKTTWYFKNEFCSTGYEEKCITYNFEKFFKPYLKITDYKFYNQLADLFTNIDADDKGGLLVKFLDGSSAVFSYFSQDIYFFPIGSHVFESKHNVYNKDRFLFGFYPKSPAGVRTKYFKGKGMEPYIGPEWDGTDETLPCLMKTKLNGWKFPDDCNPFK